MTLPIVLPSGETLREKRQKVRRMKADCVARNPVPFHVFSDLVKIDQAYTLLIKQAEKMEKKP